MLYQKFFFKILYPFYETILKQRSTFKYFNTYLNNQEKTADYIKIHQLEQLKSLLRHCYKNVPYYTAQWDEIGFDPELLTDSKQLEQLPLLTKSLVKENYDLLKAKNYLGKNITKTTGGSTGVPFKFEHDRDNYDRRQGVTWRGYGWAGCKLGDRTLYFWGGAIGDLQKKNKMKDSIYNWFYNRRIVNVFSMKKNNIRNYIDEINSFKPDGIVAYTGPLYEIAKYILEEKIKISNIKWIISGAEPLFEVQRNVIERAFSAPLFNTYGCREFTLIAAECNLHNGLHINEDHLLVEITDDRGNGKGDVGNVVITDLYNYGMPLIRYVNGDVALKKIEPCRCGLPFSQLAYVDGRRLDKIITASGSMLPGEFFPHMLKDVLGISKFQVIQKQVDQIEINLVITELYESESTETYIRGCIEDMVGIELNIMFNYVSEIKLTATGKHRVTISEIIEPI